MTTYSKASLISVTIYMCAHADAEEKTMPTLIINNKKRRWSLQ